MSVTIKDVAKAAGVSTATVSKVINGMSSVSEDTVAKVSRIMKELNYHPNLTAQNFARKSTRNIAFVTALGRDTAFINPHMFEIMSGVHKSLASKNYSLSLYSINSEEEMETVDRIIAQKSVDGMVIHASVLTKDMSQRIIKAGFPHIIIGCPNFDSQLCWIDNNNYLSGEIAANHLIEQGYQKVAFIGGLDSDLISSRRLQGAKTALSEKQMVLQDSFIKTGESSRQEGCRMMEEILSMRQRPDSVICANNHIALGVVKAIEMHHLSIPEEIGVITFDDYPFSRISDPMMSVVNIDVYDLGVQAGKLIMNKIKIPNLQVQSYSTLPNLIIRESTKRQGKHEKLV